MSGGILPLPDNTSWRVKGTNVPLRTFLLNSDHPEFIVGSTKVSFTWFRYYNNIHKSILLYILTSVRTMSIDCGGTRFASCCGRIKSPWITKISYLTHYSLKSRFKHLIKFFQLRLSNISI